MRKQWHRGLCASRPLALAAVLAGVVMAPAAAAPLFSESRDARAPLPLDSPPPPSDACLGGNRGRCHLHTYKVTVTANAITVSGTGRSTGTIRLTMKLPVRVIPTDRGPQFRTWPNAKPITFVGSGTEKNSDCSSSWKLGPGRVDGFVGSIPGGFRGGRRPYNYSLWLNFGLEMSRFVPLNCSGGAYVNFRKNGASYDLGAQITVSSSARVDVELNYPRRQRAGKLEFPINRLAEGKGFVLDVKGSYKEGGGGSNSSSGRARIVFEPVRS